METPALTKEKKFTNQTELPTTMKAAVLVAPKKVELHDVNLPKPATDEVLIKLEGCGLCASNIPVWQGRDWFDYPQEPGNPGHEGWGTIAAVGEGVKNLQPGDRVAALSYKAYAEYDIAKANEVMPLGTSLKGKPFPGEPLGCAMNIFRRSDIKAGQTVAIVGVGFLGALLIQLAKAEGARVIAISRRRFSLDVAKEMGADETIRMNDHYQIIEQVKKFTHGDFCDRVIEATGKEWPLNLAGELTKIRGRLIIAGFHQDGMRQVNIQLWNWRGLDVVNAHERDPKEYLRGMKEAADAVATGRMGPTKLYTHSFSLNEIEKAFTMLEERPDGFMKALLNIN